MQRVTLYSVPPLITAILFAVLGAYVYVKKHSSPANRAYAMWCLTTVYWQFCWTILFSTHNSAVAGLLIRIGYSGIIFIPIAFYDFVISFLKRPRIAVYVSYTIGFLLAISVWIDSLFINGLSVHPWGYYPKAGLLHPAYLLFLTLLVTHGVILLVRALKAPDLSAINSNQIKWVLAATLSYTLASVDFAVNYGVDFYPFGFAFTLVSFSLVTYAITKHRLMDVTVIIRKTLIYSVVTGTLTVCYLGIVALFAHIFEGWTGYQTVFSSAVAAALITMGFQPLRKRVQGFVDGKFFRQYVDREEKLYELSREVITHTTPEAMAQSLIRVLSDTLHPKSASLYLKAREGNGFTLVSQQGIQKLPERMPESNPLTDYFADHPQPFVQQDLPREIGEPLDTRRPPRKEDAA